MHPYVEHTKEVKDLELEVSTTMTLPEYVERSYDTVGHENMLHFIKGLEAYCEDWEICNELAKYLNTQVVELLSSGHGTEDPVWKATYIEYLEECLTKLKGGK